MGAFSDFNLLQNAFAAVSATRPDKTAVIDGTGELTFRQLDERSDTLAAAILRTGGSPGDNVGVYLNRSCDVVVAILGVLKAGRCYVPLDPSFPDERLQYLTADSGLRTVVTSADLHPGRLGENILGIGIAGGTAEAGDPPALPQGDAAASAYIIYTSGSTGKPKGVVVSHHNVLRLLDSTVPQFGFSERDTWTMFHSVGFDFSVWEMWGALLTGGTVVVVPYAVSRSSREFYELLASSGTTVLNITASAFRHLLPICLEQGGLPALKTIVFGGEKLEMSMLRPWVEAYGAERTALVNMYGITEVTVHATFKRLNERDVLERTDSPIGKALPDLVVLLLDEAGRPAELNQPGEMYIEGAGVALGYYQRPDLTAERFVHMTGADGRTVRAYRTGDLVVRYPDGELSYLSRADSQLKVRGFRVEPQEIEACLCSHPDVSAVVVAVFDYEMGDQRLVAFYVPHDRDTRSHAGIVRELKELAKATLPIHMRPSEYSRIDALPINGNGKLDRRLLIKPERNMNTTIDTEFDVQAKVYAAVTQAIGVDAMGKHDDFFEAGGTSLTLLRVLAKINEQFGVKVNMSALAEEASIASLANAILQQRQN